VLPRSLIIIIIIIIIINCTHTAESADVKVKHIFNIPNYITCSRRAATHPRNMACFRYIIVNTLHY
jgi:hypothetical protein